MSVVAFAPASTGNVSVGFDVLEVAISVLVLGFSGGMLAVSDEPNDKAIYMSLISSILSYWLGRSGDGHPE